MNKMMTPTPANNPRNVACHIKTLNYGIINILSAPFINLLLTEA